MFTRVGVRTCTSHSVIMAPSLDDILYCTTVVRAISFFLAPSFFGIPLLLWLACKLLYSNYQLEGFDIQYEMQNAYGRSSGSTYMTLSDFYF